jgi:D-alanyl-D-alanine carboxypeptidase/D-alanyl-D-alanine-endopeptidase (penicillin-binding protein 4)
MGGEQSAAGVRATARKVISVALLAITMTLAATAGAQGQADLPAPVRDALAQLNLPPEQVSLLVMPKHGGPPRLAWLADQPRAPASVLKLVTTMVALERLGPAWRWRTELLAPQPPDTHGVLRGPLVLRGNGDPDFTFGRLQDLLRELRRQGVQRIEGDVWLDRRAFEPARPELGAPPFDETPDAYYNVIPDALLLHSNLLFLQLRATQDRIVATPTSPPLQGLSVDTRGFMLRDGPCADWESTWQPPEAESTTDGRTVVRLKGSFPRNCSADTETNVVERNAYWGHVLRALWQELGGRWHGQVRDGAAPVGAVVLATRASDTLADIVKRVNKPSDNSMARLLYLTLGAQALQGRPGDTRAAADAVLRDWLQRHDVDTTGLVLDNGSGLSRTERITARQLAQVLHAGADSDFAPELETSLPIAAVDGTLRRRLKDTPAAVHARLKTGTLRDVDAVAGYVRDTARRDWIVVAIINGPEGRKARPVLDALVVWVAGNPVR